MSKKLLSALVILALTIIVLIFNRGDVEINLLVGEVSPLKSIAFLAFLGVGVVVGVLLK